MATVEQNIRTLEGMPCSTVIEMRNRALVAFVILTGARDGAVASAKIKHIDLDEKSFYQDARDVNRKFSKTFTTYFFPLGELPLKVLAEWIDYLISELGYKQNSPLFPKTKLAHNDSQQFEAIGLLQSIGVRQPQSAKPLPKLLMLLVCLILTLTVSVILW